MKQTALAPANIAFIKYWGKADPPDDEAGDALRLPLNDSLSMNLSGAYTVTTVEFSETFVKDEVTLLDGTFSEKEIGRVVKGLDRIREKARSKEFARVVTKNTFPKGAGSAASASGFAALTVAGFAALGVKLSEKELTIVARTGSGSACRSIPDGFVEWVGGKTSAESYAYSLYPSTYWDIRDLLVIVDTKMKKTSSTEGMEAIRTSPYLATRLSAIPKRIDELKKAMEEKHFVRFGEIIEEDCLDMHHVMQTQVPPLMYWNDTTKQIMNAVATWRKAGLPVYFTIDAGPNVHLICEGKDEQRVLDMIKGVSGIEEIILNKPSKGAQIISEHLF